MCELPSLQRYFGFPRDAAGFSWVGGTTVRAGRIQGADRMTEMMLAGRKYDSREGQSPGFAHYAVGEGEVMPLALELAGKIAWNAPLSKKMEPPSFTSFMSKH